ncbi:MAG: undecaprenyldiphospho-muramoylpentapeptide beta-N-acetylglucosaminyltransferase [Syntrophotaleaceae bacterium]
MKLLLAGGGTGGHLFPAVALAERLLETDKAAQVLFVGTSRGIEARVLPGLGLPLETIEVRGLVGQGWRGRLRLLPCLFKSFHQSLRILDRFRPDMVLGVGGYASGPLLLAARWKKLPTVIHEQNAWPGLTNRILSRWAERVFLSFSEADRAFNRGRTMLTGNPLRRGMEDCPPIPQGKPTLLIFGGSRGARAINQAVIEALPLLEEFRGRLHILHQTGSDDHDRVRRGYLDAGWEDAEILPFIDDMAAAYARSHLIVCRAGATTIAELSACGRPAILIPYPFAAADHQTANARALARKGAALLLAQDDLTGERLARLAGDLLKDRERLLFMAGVARSQARLGAADLILRECRRIAKKPAVEAASAK